MHDETCKTVFDWIYWLYKNSMQATGHSWTRLNGCLRLAVIQAIDGGIEFDLDSFEQLYRRCNGSYWFGNPDSGECFYSCATESGNLSACKSFESWKQREPFIVEGNRLSIGSEIWRDGVRFKVTSFNDEKKSLTACSYKPLSGGRIDRRITLTAEQLRKEESARNAEKRKAKKAAKEEAEKLEA